MTHAPGPQASLSGGPIQPKARINWIQWFIISQIVCQLVLLTDITTGPSRAVVRVVAYGISLVFLLVLHGGLKPHPATKPALFVFLLVALSFFNPGTDTVASGLAQIAMYVAILGPLFWMSRIRLDCKMLRAVLLTVWTFYSLSAFFGILQVYYPGKFQPHLSAQIAAKGAGYVKSLSFRLPTGQRAFRPMGLTDMPGGAGAAGFYAVLLGLGFLIMERRFLWRCVFMASMFLGMTCLYLSQVRSILVMLACCVIVLFFVLFVRGSTEKLAAVAPIVIAVGLVSFIWAIAVGGGKVEQRFHSLTQDSLANTYYKNRGIFLKHTITTLLPQFPLGAGLGRWGMTNTYFGNHARSIWVEIQWTGWLLDGGIPLILAYGITLIVAFWTAWRIALTRQSEVGMWGAVVLAFNIGVLAQTFDSPVFIGQLGMEFWTLNAALFAAARNMPAFPLRAPMPLPQAHHPIREAFAGSAGVPAFRRPSLHS